MRDRIDAYFATLGSLGLRTEATDETGRRLGLDEAFGWFIDAARSAHESGGKLMFVGNGGSAAIASHMAVDYSKNGGLRSLAFNDGAMLTCLSNDLGYENSFATPVSLYGKPGDILVAISSSGRSPNILGSVEAARAVGCRVVTLSGFGAANPLRRTGDLNLYVANDQYGFVEITHLSLLHAMLDLAMGWTAVDVEAVV
ncbi:D-sedoheptulose 7-phosphate isomerase [Azospirillum brasilense]|uniref:D-sedoheptulose 7-phosphate isomerase n=1 Tax=Azospirillum brasilense TaxID=192 RepID=A0A560AL36_AZOBR|nr:SIS domain-containing protein [Azospirillum brasilense]TWA61039.1 D-sedoheptulose 7-phosphate isomerase [Azospirillum brasilense]